VKALAALAGVAVGGGLLVAGLAAGSWAFLVAVL
jgi:hypothetical protein